MAPLVRTVEEWANSNYEELYAMEGEVTEFLKANPSMVCTFFEPITEQYFEATYAAVLLSEFDINQKLIEDGAVDVSEYLMIFSANTNQTLLPSEDSEDYGWDRGTMEEFFKGPWISFSHVATEKNGKVSILIVPSSFPTLFEEVKFTLL